MPCFPSNVEESYISKNVCDEKQTKSYDESYRIPKNDANRAEIDEEKGNQEFKIDKVMKVGFFKDDVKVAFPVFQKKIIVENKTQIEVPSKEVRTVNPEYSKSLIFWNPGSQLEFINELSNLDLPCENIKPIIGQKNFGSLKINEKTIKIEEKTTKNEEKTDLANINLNQSKKTSKPKITIVLNKKFQKIRPKSVLNDSKQTKLENIEDKNTKEGQKVLKSKKVELKVHSSRNYDTKVNEEQKRSYLRKPKETYKEVQGIVPDDNLNYETWF